MDNNVIYRQYLRTCYISKGVEILIQTNANLDLYYNECNRTALMMSVSNACSSEKTVQMLVDAKATVDLQDGDGNTALLLSVGHLRTYSTEKSVEILIDARANVNMQNYDGDTSLDLIWKYNKKSYLIEKLLLLNARHNTKELYKIRCDIYRNQVEKRQSFIRLFLT